MKSTVKQLRIDHVTIAGSWLKHLRAAFAECGLQSEYGGRHSNQITHMAVLGFDDGSYIELISTIKGGYESPWWHQHILYDGGACGWAVEVGDIAREAARIAAHGMPVRGPSYHHRERPDGISVEWDLAFPGDYEPGSKLPFLISDRTPRSLRVRASPSVTGSELTGVRKVVLGVEDLSSASQLFMQVFGWLAPEVDEEAEFGARLAAFAGQPVILAQPTSYNWLQQRLDTFGECPCAYLIGSRNLQASVQKRELIPAGTWFQREVAWFDAEKLAEIRLGVMAT